MKLLIIEVISLRFLIRLVFRGFSLQVKHIADISIKRVRIGR